MSKTRAPTNCLGAPYGPCAKCGQAHGPNHPPSRHKSPTRTSGERFGILGDLCGTCYNTAYVKWRRAEQKKSKPDRRRRRRPAACAQ